MMMKTLRPVVVFLTCATIVACRGGAPVAPNDEVPTARLSRLEREAGASHPSAALLAETGVTAWLVAGDEATARRWLERAIATDAGEPLAHFALAKMARMHLDDLEAAMHALAVLERAPTSAWAELSASLLYDLSQTSPRIDAAIEQSLAKLDRESMGLTGRAAVRAREALLATRDGRNADDVADATRRALGLAPAWTVVGPLAAFRLRSFDTPSPFDDPRHVLQARYEAPAGAVSPRTFPTRDGLLSLDAESWRGDVFEALVDVNVTKGGTHVVALRGATTARVWLDGALVVDRRTLPERAPMRSWGTVELAEGRHRLRVRLARSEAAWSALVVARADGAPSAFSTAPVQPGAQPAIGSKPSASPERSGSRVAAEATLSQDPRNPVALWTRLLALQEEDPERARDELGLFAASTGETNAVRSLRAELAASDPDLPDAVADAKSRVDYEAVVEKDPTALKAGVILVERARKDKLWDAATARLDALRSAVKNPPAVLELVRARILLDRGDIAAAARATDAALAADPGRCEALDVRFDLARRNDDVARADALSQELLACPGGLAARMSLLRDRSRYDDALVLAERQVARATLSVNARRTLSDIHVARGDLPAAIATLEPVDTLFPRRTDVLPRLADLNDLAGNAEKASELRRRALANDGGQLGLARAVASESSGEVLGWAARDGLAVIAEYLRSGETSTAPAVQVLDLGAFEVQPDGSAIERVHSIVQVLDKRGIDRFGEVNVPDDAQVLVMRTVKPDGRVLDAELIAAKESVSMPNLEPGDFVEYEFVRGHDARPPGIPGWQGGQFFFRGPDVPFVESTYLVRAPASVGLEIDGANLDKGAPKQDGDWITYAYTSRHGEPHLREPLTVSDAELLPWVEAGAGASLRDHIANTGEWVALRTRATGEVRALVHGLASLPMRERVDTVVQRIRDVVKADASTADFSEGAGTIVARARGNRLTVLKAALDVLGIPSHVLLVRPFGVNQQESRFPRPELFAVAVLRIEPPGAEPLYMEFAQRHAPSGLLPSALGGCDAWVVPAPGEEPQRITLPVVDVAQDRSGATLDLALAADGVLSGTMVQTFHGFSAASMRRRVDQMTPAELRQQQERALSGLFRGAVLEEFNVDDTAGDGAPLVLKARFTAPRFARRAEGALVLPANFGPQTLGQRYLGRAERRGPLLLGAGDLSELKARVTLPEGMTIELPAPVEATSEIGTFRATWMVDGKALTYDERLELKRGRVPPERYAGLKAFAATVDAAQARELSLRPVQR